jgi:hypothetical protein
VVAFVLAVLRATAVADISTERRRGKRKRVEGLGTPPASSPTLEPVLPALPRLADESIECLWGGPDAVGRSTPHRNTGDLVEVIVDPSPMLGAG